MNNYIYKQTTGKRFLANLLDLILVIVFAFFVYVPVEYVAFAAGAGVHKLEFAAILHYSELYDVNMANNTIQVVNKDEQYAKALFGFYVDKTQAEIDELMSEFATVTINGINFNTYYGFQVDDNNGVPAQFKRGFAPLLVNNHEFNTVEDYYTVVLGKGNPDTLFDFDLPIDEDAKWDVPVKAGKETAAINFYRNATVDPVNANNALRVLEQNARLGRVVSTIYYIDFIKIISAFLTSALFLLVLLPLAFKGKATLGKVITRSSYTTKYGYKPTKMQIFFRNLTKFILNYILFFLPFHVVSLLMSAFSKNGASLFDVISGTIVVDKTKSLIFNNADDQTQYQAELNKRVARHVNASKKP